MAIMLATAAVSAVASGDPINLVLIAGDVNAGPVGSVSSLNAPLDDFVISQPSVLLRSATNGVDDQSEWSPAAPNGDAFGVEMSLAHTLAASYPGHSFGIMRFSMSSASLACDWQPAQCGAGVMQSMLGRIALWRSELAASGVESRVIGMVWMHGAADAGDEASATMYGANLIEILAAIRTEFADTALPVVATLPQSGGAWLPVVRRSIDEVARGDANAAVATLDTFEVSGDGITLSDAGTIAAGISLGDLLLGRNPLDDAMPPDECENDLVPDGVVDVADLLYLIGWWGPCNDCRLDFDGDGIIGVDDLLHMISQWGQPSGDVTGDGLTNIDDMLAMLGAWGPCDPDG
jgi:hypothetical protein